MQVSQTDITQESLDSSPACGTHWPVLHARPEEDFSSAAGIRYRIAKLFKLLFNMFGIQYNGIYPISFQPRGACGGATGDLQPYDSVERAVAKYSPTPTSCERPLQPPIPLHIYKEERHQASQHIRTNTQYCLWITRHFTRPPLTHPTKP